MPVFQLDRRAWLRAGCVSGLTACAPTKLLAIEPLKREIGAQFHLSLAAYSYRNLLTGNQPKLTLFDFIDDCARFGLAGAELTSYYFQQPCTDDYLRALKRHCFRQGLNVSGTAIRCDFGIAPGPQRDQELATVREWIRRAEILGAPMIRIFAGHRAPGHSPEQSHALIVEGIQASCDVAAKHGVHLALENHGGPTATAEGLLRIVRDVRSPWFGVNLDTGNFHSDMVYQEIAAAAPYAINVQVKVVVSGPDKIKRPADLSRLAQILRTANYRGYVVLEYEEDGDPRRESQRYLEELAAALSA